MSKKICPLMTKPVGNKINGYELFEVECYENDCAFWAGGYLGDDILGTSYSTIAWMCAHKANAIGLKLKQKEKKDELSRD